MSLMTPDPTFYPSPKQAMRAPREQIAYVAVIDPTFQRPDALAVIDVDPGSPAYGKEISRLELPYAGDELHHFGWNACSAALCPTMPHPHMERRYLLIPGLRSSRMYAQPLVEVGTLRLGGALALLAFGVYKLAAGAHPRWVGMRVGLRELALWSFLMATAHGAGLMLVPVVLSLPAADAHAAHLVPAAALTVAPAADAHDHAAHDHAAGARPAGGSGEERAPSDGRAAGVAAVALHTAAMFAAMAGVAIVVYEKLGLAVLRRAWLNLDLLWAWSLILAGAIALPWPCG